MISSKKSIKSSQVSKFIISNISVRAFKRNSDEEAASESEPSSSSSSFKSSQEKSKLLITFHLIMNKIFEKKV